MEAGFSATGICESFPGAHPSRKFAMGCGSYRCPERICRKKFLNRRMWLAWDDRLEHFEAPLVHGTFTVPPEYRGAITDVKAFRRVAREVFESWARESCRIAEDEQAFLLDVFHPEGGKNPGLWHPHANVFLPECVITPDGKLRHIVCPRVRKPQDLGRRWAAALTKLTGREVRRAELCVSAHPFPDDRFFALKAELRSFPGWPSALGRMIWAAAFGPRVWHRNRKLLGIPEPRDRRIRCAEPVGTDNSPCGARIVSFTNLSPVGRAQVRAAEDRTGHDILEGWEREWDGHTHCAPDCECRSCALARLRRNPAVAALKKTNRAAQLAKEIATSPENAAAVAPGGPLYTAAQKLRADYVAFQQIGTDDLTVQKAKAPREAFLEFIRQADALGLTSDPGRPWPARYRDLLRMRELADQEHARATGQWRLSFNWAWDELPI